MTIKKHLKAIATELTARNLAGAAAFEVISNLLVGKTVAADRTATVKEKPLASCSCKARRSRKNYRGKFKNSTGLSMPMHSIVRQVVQNTPAGAKLTVKDLTKVIRKWNAGIPKFNIYTCVNPGLRQAEQEGYITQVGKKGRMPVFEVRGNNSASTTAQPSAEALDFASNL